MRSLLIFISICSITLTATAQNRDFTMRKKNSKAFGGARDFSDYRPHGLQLSFGPSYTFTKVKNSTFSPDSMYQGQRFRYELDPAGRIGFYAEVGMAHFPMKKPKVLLFGHRLLSYVDWGLGAKIHGGKETTLVQYTDATGQNVIAEEKGVGSFYNTYGTARFAAHYIYYFPNNIHFIDNGLGFNGDYRIGGGNKNYQGIHFPETQRFQNNLGVQLHYDLAFGWKMRRGYYITAGPQLPILGIYEWNKGNPSINWFSSKYYPVIFKVKFIWLMKKKSNGCTPGSEEDKKRNQEYQQNR
jgi:hypothetical protein